MSAPNGSGGPPPPFASSTSRGGSARGAAIEKIKAELRRLEDSLRDRMHGNQPRDASAAMREARSTGIEAILLNIVAVRACLLQHVVYDIESA